MPPLDRASWQIMRFIGLMQGYIFNLLYPYAKTLQEKMKIIQYSMSGYYLWSTPPEEMPREVVAKIMPIARLLFILTIYNISSWVVDTIRLFI
jgi:hypothetical protein